MKSRSITLQLPEEFIDLCAGHGVPPGMVLRGFIADLCGLASQTYGLRDDGYASHGPAERELAYAYYEGVGYPYWRWQP